MSTDRFDQLHDEYLDAWVEDNLRHLYEACADYIPWTDAKPSSEEITAMDTWIVLIEDRHTDVDAVPFSSEERAIEYARTQAPADAAAEPLNDAMRRDGWVFYLPYGLEGDRVRVVKRTMDGK